MQEDILVIYMIGQQQAYYTGECSHCVDALSSTHMSKDQGLYLHITV